MMTLLRHALQDKLARMGFDVADVQAFIPVQAALTAAEAVEASLREDWLERTKIQCEHVKSCCGMRHFVWDIDVRTSGPRFAIELCQECYNRLLGAVAGDLINEVVRDSVRFELRKVLTR